jgi:hypothetical protein
MDSLRCQMSDSLNSLFFATWSKQILYSLEGEKTFSSWMKEKPIQV